MNLSAVEKLIESKGLEYFLCSFVEMGGMPKAKLVPVTHLRDMASEGAGFVIGILTGAVRFMMDLLSNMPDEFARNVDYDFIGVSSYAGSQSLGEVTIRSEPAVDLRRRHVLLVDGIVDTGLTLHRVLSCIRARSPESVKVCALLDKTTRRQRDVPVDYCGFSVGDEFVVGYGMDFEHGYRSLPYIGVLDSQAPASSPKRG